MNYLYLAVFVVRFGLFLFFLFFLFLGHVTCFLLKLNLKIFIISNLLGLKWSMYGPILLSWARSYHIFLKDNKYVKSAMLYELRHWVKLQYFRYMGFQWSQSFFFFLWIWKCSQKKRLGAQACNSSCLGSRDQKVCGLRPAW
jgi:hypothetical protein